MTRARGVLRRYLVCFTFGIVTYTAAQGLAAAQSTGAEFDGPDEVTLKAGGTLRGTIISVEPGKGVVISEPGAKEPRTLPWSQVADVQKGKFKPPPTSTLEPGPVGPGYDTPEPGSNGRDADEDDDADSDDSDDSEDPSKAAPPPIAMVHLETDTAVTLMRRERRGSTASDASVCESPCDHTVDVPVGARFYIAGDGVTTSSDFKLVPGQNAHIKVGAGSVAGRIIGTYVLVPVGVVGMVGGVTGLILGATGVGGNSEQGSYYLGGGVALGLGTALFVTGIAVAVANRTTFHFDESSQANGGDRFAIDDRPASIQARPWLGEF
ncbi:MAG: hypothetical protein U0271_40140 [Polyangiaceae bacterium]